MSKQPPFSTKYPLRCKDGTPVTILTTEGRDPAYPTLGYVGEDTELVQWDSQGKSKYFTRNDGGDLVNIPTEGKVTIVTFKNGKTEVYSGEVSYEDEAFGEAIVSLAYLPFSIMPGQRDDKVLENIVAEFDAPEQ